MANSITTPVRRFSKLIGTAAIAGALFAPSFAQAALLDFESSDLLQPLIGADQVVQFGEFYVKAFGDVGAEPTDLVGALATIDDCFEVQCPGNNNTSFYTSFNDGFMVFGRNNNATFRLNGFKASFVGAGMATYPTTAGVLVLQGFDINQKMVGASQQFGLRGPTNNMFNFADFSAGAFGNTTVASVRVRGFACDISGSCNRVTNQANFAIDDIVTTTVPEPGSWALMALALAGLAAFSRRRA